MSPAYFRRRINKRFLGIQLRNSGKGDTFLDRDTRPPRNKFFLAASTTTDFLSPLFSLSSVSSFSVRPLSRPPARPLPSPRAAFRRLLSKGRLCVFRPFKNRRSPYRELARGQSLLGRNTAAKIAGKTEKIISSLANPAEISDTRPAGLSGPLVAPCCGFSLFFAGNFVCSSAACEVQLVFRVQC